MPLYRDLRDERKYTPDEKDWVSRRLLDLRARLKEPAPTGVPNRTLRSSLIVGTWNIRDFDNNKYRNGPRRRESLQYMAEILSSFDICAIQEVNEDLEPLEEVVRLLGKSWQYIATDVTQGASGNRERMAFVFDTRKVSFRNIAGEVVLPKHKLLPNEQQFARTPFIVSFQAGWFRFALCTVHIYFGQNSKNSEGYRRRVDEINFIAEELASRAKREDENYILLGDFNIKNPIDETMQALTKAGFILPPQLFPSNILGNKYYDQIAFQTKKDEVTFISAGVFDFSKAVFLPEHYEHYAPILPKRHRDLKRNGDPKDVKKDKDYYSRRWLTWQMSDHLPLWVELAIDFSDEHLLHNLSDEAAKKGAAAQIELEDEDGHDLAIQSEVTGIQIQTPDDIEDTEKSTPRKTKKRSKPRLPDKDKVGTARPDQPLTWKLAWQIFKFVASGRAEEMKKRRDKEKKQARHRKKSR
ncbi:MAG: endonuclease [Ponticaulis sp.]|nr:endonuclease [Ponticaulis sp.]|tara:strand:- start:9404 stop:10807 length:1404 start_codon:yes stop_codon:yes gene_type:complete